MTGWSAHVSIGPVQGFVEEARRARDWWSGSFLLAWLAGRVMRAVQGEVRQGEAPRRCYGTVVYPILEGDPTWLALRGEAPGWPVGTLPNRFMVRLCDPEGFAADDPCGAAVRGSFNDLAEEVWRHFLDKEAVWSATGEPEKERERSRAIWDRQVRTFFEVSWVIAGEGQDGNLLLDRRKLCRDHPKEPEPGDHCRMVGDLQELSGLIRSERGGREAQDQFWGAVRKAVRERVYPRETETDYELLELGATERLSAIGLVKRLWPLLPDCTLGRVIGWPPYGEARDRRRWPSTATVASVPWRRWAWGRSPTECLRFAHRAEGHLPAEVAGERSRLPVLVGMEKFGAVEGALLYGDALDARRRREPERAGRIEAVAKALRDLQKAVEPTGGGFRERKFRAAVPYYAALVMDGDKVGELVGDEDLRGPTSRALQAFTAVVAGKPGGKEGGLVEREFDGVLVYAGGDDVQAFLPLDRAIGCALELREAYLRAFREAGVPQAATISGALVLADHGEPMGAVIREARGLLKDKAKKGNGRDSLVVAVRRPSGSTLELVSAFPGPFGAILDLAEAFARAPDDHATSFLYRVRERLGDLVEGRLAYSLDSEDRTKLLLAEWLRNRKARDVAWREVKQIEAAATVRSNDKGRDFFRLDGPLLARFLADRGVTLTTPGKEKGS
jgi:CRISPR-associated protein Cmr2